MPKRTDPSGYDELVESGAQKKESRLYKRDTAEFVDGRISELVHMSSFELAEIADSKAKVNLADLDTLKRRTLIYTRACEQTATLPTFSGLARSLGISTEALNVHMRRHPDSDTTEWLRVCHDSFADQLAAAALHGLTQPVVSIFTLKARSGWKEAISIEAVQHDPLGAEQDAEMIAEKYAELYKNLPED